MKIKALGIYSILNPDQSGGKPTFSHSSIDWIHYLFCEEKLGYISLNLPINVKSIFSPKLVNKL